MTVRPAGPAEIGAVAALDRQLFGDDAWSADQVAQELRGDNRAAWVVGDPVAGYVVTRTVGEVTDLQRIAVHPDHRRRGLAHALLAVAVAQAPGERMLLEVSVRNSGARAFYTAEGFVEIDRRRRYYRDGSDAVVMQRTLRDC